MRRPNLAQRLIAICTLGAIALMVAYPPWQFDTFSWIPWGARIGYAPLTRPPGYPEYRRRRGPYPIVCTSVLTLQITVVATLGAGLIYLTRTRDKPGLCRRCGYDLRGTLAAGRIECPECGEAVPAVDSADHRSGGGVT